MLLDNIFLAIVKLVNIEKTLQIYFSVLFPFFLYNRICFILYKTYWTMRYKVSLRIHYKADSCIHSYTITCNRSRIFFSSSNSDSNCLISFLGKKHKILTIIFQWEGACIFENTYQCKL